MDNTATVYENNLVILDLYQRSKQNYQLGTQAFSRKNSYLELDGFRERIKNQGLSPHPLPYSSMKKKTLAYKLIFFALGVLFILLGLIIFKKSSAWYFAESYFLAAKSILCFFSIAAGSLALLIGHLLTPEKEALYQVMRRAKDKLKKVYTKKRWKAGVQRLFLFGEKHKKAVKLYSFYRDAHEKFLERKEHLSHLFDHIAEQALDQAEQENLYNQAILEFSDHLDYEISCFSNTCP